MKKGKNGYTLIETIICIVLIVLIGTISVISVKKKEKNNNELLTEYVEKIKLDTAIYVEKNKSNIKFSSLTSPNDFTFIQLKDLIDIGILDENLYNPICNNISKKCDYSLVKVFLDSESNVDIEYPTEYEKRIRNNIPDDAPSEEIKDKIDSYLNNAFIHLKKNNENGNKFVLPNSLEMINVINDLISNKTYKSAYEFYSDLYNGNYNIYNDPGYYLADADGNVINTTDSDWCITKEKVYSGKNKKKWNNKWKYTYEICKESSIYIAYKNVNSEENIRIVDMVDDDGPVLLADNDNHEFISGVDYFYALDNNYNGYLDFWSMYYNNKNTFYVYDNYDGSSYDVPNRLSSLNFTYNLLTQNLLLEDSNKNSRTYTVDVSLFSNEKPYVYYTGPTYLYDYEVYYSNGELYPFYDSIYADDIDNNLEFTSYYLYDDNGNYYYQGGDSTYISTGNYTLNLEACDTYSACAYETYEIYIDYYSYDPGYDNYDPDSPYDYDDNGDYCDVACQMYNNSQAWYDASPEERERLHQENERLSELLPSDSYYTEDGYWHNSDGSLLYDPNFGSYGYNDHYDYSDYDDYGSWYDCCW